MSGKPKPIKSQLPLVAALSNSGLLTLENAKTLVFWLLVYRYLLKTVRHVRATGVSASLYDVYLSIVKRIFGVVLLIPSARKKVLAELDKATLEVQAKIAPAIPHLPSPNSLPEHGLPDAELSAVLDNLSNLPNTKWEDGRVSGAVYHGGEEMEKVWVDAFQRFSVSNPLHADVFPGVRHMDAAIVKMCLTMYNNPPAESVLEDVGGVGTTTSGGTESILMACKAYRDRALAEKGITEPEMVIPISAHAAFDKAGAYFGIKVHHIPVDTITRKVDLRKVKKAINPNTIMLVGSAPNFPDGMIDDIPALGKLATKYDLGLHVDCCLGSFIVPFLERAGFPVEHQFDFRVKGVTSISCDTHKYGFAPKGCSVIMYRNNSYRKHQYSVMTAWPGGVYASPSMAGSRPGALLAGCYASMMHMGQDGYLASCRQIVGAAKRIEAGIRSDFSELFILGKPLASVVAFGSDSLSIYEIGDRMSKLGWHLNALQNPPALHIACTRLTVPVIDDFFKDLRTAVDASKVKDGSGQDGSMVTIYGLGSSSAIGPGLLEDMSRRYMSVLYA